MAKEQLDASQDFVLQSALSSEAQPQKTKLRWPYKVVATVLLIDGVVMLPLMVLVVLGCIALFAEGRLASTVDINDSLMMGVFILQIVLMLVYSAMALVLSLRLFRNKRRNAALQAEIMIGVLVLIVLCYVMSSGFNEGVLWYALELVALIAVSVFVDPTLTDERELQRKLRDMETREAAEEGTLGRDETGKGYIALNFFNLFWIFTVACVLGLLIEVAYHMVIVDPGHYQDRAGMLYGPFSPIYGFGAVLLTLALNRFYKANFFIIFVVSALIGGGFEFFVSWFLETAFGIVAWDYTGSFLSIDGRTNGMFMAMWGALGVVWIKLSLPLMLKLVNLMPWKWRYSVTTVCAALMIANGAMTLLALDCWYGRLADEPQDTPMEQFFGEHYDNAFMEQRFQSMSIDPSNAARH